MFAMSQTNQSNMAQSQQGPQQQDDACISKMNIYDLPPDCFNQMLHYLSVDERIEASRSFPSFENCFGSMWRITKRRTALAIRDLIFEPKLDNATSKMCTKFHAFHSWDCSFNCHKAVEYISSNLAVTEPCSKCGQMKLLCILKQCPLISSIDLRGVTLTTDLIEGILKFCPDFCCLKLDFASFDSPETLDLFVREMSPKLVHLSMNNLFITKESNSYSRIFSSAINLNQVKILLFPNDNLLASDMKSFQKELEFIFLHFVKSRNRRLADFPSQYLASLKNSKAENLCFLKLKSNYDYIENFDLFTEAKQFNKLYAINLSLMNFYKDSLDFQVDQCWPELASLSIDMYCLRGSNNLLSAYLRGSFCKNLRTFRIMDCHFKKKTLVTLVERCPNLKNLQLIDISFRDFGNAFYYFGLLKSLESLTIEYTVKVYDYNQDERSQFADCFNFKPDVIYHITRFLKSHNNLKELLIIDWPGWKQEHFDQLKPVIEEKQLHAYFREY